ncbi:MULTISPECIES: serine aminopeptidase domain-containing protein [Mycobacterium]|uniref:serine aminopeptidase domain-containing protein n=1 Tax=Mycobacterium TaxID=1763 RepID=UPI001EF2B10F|nr:MULTISPECIES: alpha/beta hydrolase [Mycobacterium]MCG7611342.1 alpha/beta hydrolase [Mycobacterium sp. CnD-18-1]
MGTQMAAESGTQGVPTWFGPEQSRLFGVVHVPDGGIARAGVVICPPLGRQHLDTYRGLKLLAQQLCARGFAVLRFDYRGTGDSTGAQCLDSAVDDYVESIRTAVGYLRACGLQSVSLVGLRAGALLAATAAPSIDGLEGLVMWDPVTDGRRYLREQKVLYQMTVGGQESAELPPEADSVPLLGLTLSATAAADLGALKVPDEVGATSILVLSRPELAGDRRLAGLRAANNCTIQEIAGQPEFVEPPSIVVKIPMDTLAMIEKWLDANLTSETVAFQPAFSDLAVVDEMSDGRKVMESITELGPSRLFAIRTELAGDGAGGPTVLFHNTACEHRVGSGRIWPDTARDLAALGVTAVRYDRRGVGDTGVATEDFPWMHSPVAKADVTDAVDALAVPAERLIMTGICSGAWNSAYGGLERGAKLVILLNILLYSLRRSEGGSERIAQVTDAVSGDEGTGDEDTETRRVWGLVKQGLRNWLPYRGWLLLGRLGYTQAPEVLLRALGKGRVPTELVLSPMDFDWYVGHRGPIGAKRLARRGWAPKLTQAPAGDHAVLHRGLQNFIREYLLEATRREFADQL